MFLSSTIRHLANRGSLRGCIREINSKTVAVFGIKEDRNSSFLRGAAKAPPKIKAEMVSPSANDFCELGHNVLERIEMLDDVEPPSGHFEDVCKAIGKIALFL